MRGTRYGGATLSMERSKGEKGGDISGWAREELVNQKVGILTREFKEGSSAQKEVSTTFYVFARLCTLFPRGWAGPGKFACFHAKHFGQNSRRRGSYSHAVQYTRSEIRSSVQKRNLQASDPKRKGCPRTGVKSGQRGCRRPPRYKKAGRISQQKGKERDYLGRDGSPRDRLKGGHDTGKRKSS